MVKHRWNNGETRVKQGWNNGETRVKQWWNNGETQVKQWWNKGETMVGCITFFRGGGWGGVSPCQPRVLYIVCINSLPWGHGTGKVGHLFGCERDRVIGHPSKIVAQTAIKGLKLGFGGIRMTFVSMLYVQGWCLAVYQVWIIVDLHILNLFVQRENMRKPACHIEKYHDIKIFSTIPVLIKITASRRVCLVSSISTEEIRQDSIDIQDVLTIRGALQEWPTLAAQFCMDLGSKA